MKKYTVYELIKSDVWRYHDRYTPILLLKTFFTCRTFRPILTLRLCQASKNLTFLLKIILFPPLLILHWHYTKSAGMDLPWKCKIGLGFRITHGWGLVIHDDVIIGDNVTVFHGVTIGSKKINNELISPIIGNEVIIAAGAIVIGDVKIGDGAIVGAGAIVVTDVDAYSVVVNEHSKEIQSGIKSRTHFRYNATNPW